MRIRRLIIYFITFFLSVNFHANGAALVAPFEVTFFDVWQGHFTLIHQPNLAKPPRFILVDCGTSTPLTYHDDLHKRVSEKINEYVEEDKRFTLDVIISHPDEDHYKLINTVLTPFRGRCILGVFLLGGQQADWQGERSFPKFWDTLEFNTKRAKKVYTDDASDSGLTLMSTPTLAAGIWPGNTLENNVVALWDPTKVVSENKNAKSILVYCEYYGKKILLTGDAIKDVTDNMRPFFEERGTNVMQIAHHGATEDGCNDPEWLEMLSPSFFIISSGLHKQYSHPRASVVTTCMRLLDGIAIDGMGAAGAGRAARADIRVTSHWISYFESLKKCGLAHCKACKSGQGVCLSWEAKALPDGSWEVVTERILKKLTDLPIYHTVDQGDISIRWDNTAFYDITTTTPPLFEHIPS